jgi:hypothetical protein
MRKLALFGACAAILLGGAAVPASAMAGGSGGHPGVGGHGGHGSGHGGGNGHSGGPAPSGHGGPVGFANGQSPPEGTPRCQPGVCPGMTQ